METNQTEDLSQGILKNDSKVENQSKSGVIETDDKLLEFSFFEADDVINVEQKDVKVELEPEDVVDRIFAAAKGGNPKDLSKLIFSSHSTGKVNSAEEKGKKKGISFPLKRKSPIEGLVNLASKKVCTTVKEVSHFKDIQNTFKSFSRVADETGRFVPVESRKSPPIVKETKPPAVDVPAGIYISVPRTKVTTSINKQAAINTTVNTTLSKSSENFDKNTIPINDSNTVNAQTSKTPPLIDIGVLTNAITNVLEECITKNEKSNIKLVLFCNDKPRHSFSILETLSSDVDNIKPVQELKAETREIGKNLSEASTRQDKSGSHTKTSSPTDQSLISKLNIPNLSEIHSYLRDLSPTSGPAESVGKSSKEISQSNLLITQENKLDNESDIAPNAPIKESDEVPVTTQNSSEKLQIKSKTGRKKETKKKTRSSPNKKVKIFNGFGDEDLNKDKTEETDLVVAADVDDGLEDGNLEIVEEPESNTEENNNSDLPQGNVQVGFQCTECLKVYTSKSHLKSHRKNVHGLHGDLKGYDYPQNNVVPSLDEFLEERFGGDLTEADSEKEKVNITEIDDSVSDAEKEFINLLLKRDPLTAHDYAGFEDSPQYLRQSRIVSLQNLANRESQGERYEIDPVFVCEHCGKFYHSRKSLKDHFIREHATEPDQEPLYIFIETNSYNCPICFKPFANPYNLVAHAKTHTRDEELKCAVCGKLYSSVYVLRRHIDTIHSDIRPRPFKCKFCDYAAENRWHLREHQRRHTGEQPFQCPVCLKNFSHQGTMNRHCKSTHKVIPGTPKRLFYPDANNPDSELSHVTLTDKLKSLEAEPVLKVGKLSNTGQGSNISFVPVGSVDKSVASEITKLLKNKKKTKSATTYSETLIEGGEQKGSSPENYTETLSEGGKQKEDSALSYPETFTEGGNQKCSSPTSYTEILPGGENPSEQVDQTVTEIEDDSGAALNESNIKTTAIGPDGELVIIKQEPLDD